MSYLKKVIFGICFTAGICHAQQKNTDANYSFSGLLDKKIPVELTISVSNNVVLGNIKYVKTKEKKPIKIIGKLDSGNHYHLEEFEKDGNISGIIDAVLKNGKLEGAWNSTKSDAVYPMVLDVQSKVNPKPEVFSPASSDRFEGTYTYQYGEDGYQGSITIKKIKDQMYSYDIGSVTRAPGRNIADASGEVMIKNNQFTIEINTSCAFLVTFYNGFLTITPVSSEKVSGCEFGLNATLRGTFLKVK
ncbi:hypothetical protein [Chryseobacterium vrystaatense]|uniref:Uncharacterized protein n=1 Tax=Chryseobacterium vrystaatense TaxID=307480 RepID=A0A1M5ASV2_9FLAO|nr:hypothetical protein [Chryseobacterium vrystaatense]KFF26773.1 hypothetical protein IW16_05630 [Chryseobacterium vrystaatense]SHF33321.1 hypothetical protein SAMN02787073_2022 [Chryseobacterium vrystaatense]